MTTKPTKYQRNTKSTTKQPKRYCNLREGPTRQFAVNVAGERLRLIRMNEDKWVNGTLLHFAFFENSGQFTPWAGNDALKVQVRKAFKRWQDLGIGLKFEEVSDRAQAEVRIGFERDHGHWSYVGRLVLRQGPDDRTMNLDPADGIASGDYGIDVACHEIGHSMGLYSNAQMNAFATDTKVVDTINTPASTPPSTVSTWRFFIPMSKAK